MRFSTDTFRSLLGLLLLAGGCAGDDDASTPRAACEQIADVLCSRALDCLDPVELAERGIPPDHEACVLAARARSGCADLTEADACAADEIYDGSAAPACIDDLAGLSCATLSAGVEWSVEDVGACADVCTAADPDRLGQPCEPLGPVACGAGSKCGFVLENPGTGAGSYECVPEGERGEGAVCYQPLDYGEHDDCRDGLACWDDACHAYCDVDAGCGLDGYCIAPTPDLKVCAEACALLAQDCPPSQGCYPWNPSKAVCQTAGNRWEGTSCDWSDDCAPGSICLESAGTGECYLTCNANLYPDTPSPECGYGQLCRPMNVDGPTYAGVGVCMDTY